MCVKKGWEGEGRNILMYLFEIGTLSCFFVHVYGCGEAFPERWVAGNSHFFFSFFCSFSLAVWYIPYVCFVEVVVRGRTSSLSGRFLVLSLIQVYSPAVVLWRNLFFVGSV